MSALLVAVGDVSNYLLYATPIGAALYPWSVSMAMMAVAVAGNGLGKSFATIQSEFEQDTGRLEIMISYNCLFVTICESNSVFCPLSVFKY
jgi:hypothetical protein